MTLVVGGHKKIKMKDTQNKIPTIEKEKCSYNLPSFRFLAYFFMFLNMNILFKWELYSNIYAHVLSGMF